MAIGFDAQYVNDARVLMLEEGEMRDGDVPAPDGYRRVRIDHQGYDDANLKLI